MMRRQITPTCRNPRTLLLLFGFNFRRFLDSPKTRC
jgi:hypothetical protein